MRQKFITQCSGFILQNVTVLLQSVATVLQNMTAIRKCDAYHNLYPYNRQTLQEQFSSFRFSLLLKISKVGNSLQISETASHINGSR